MNQSETCTAAAVCCSTLFAKPQPFLWRGAQSHRATGVRHRLFSDPDQKPTNSPITLHLRRHVVVVCRPRPHVVEPVGARFLPGHSAWPDVQCLTVESLARFQQWLAADPAEVLSVAAPCGMDTNGPITRGEPLEQHQIQPLFQFRRRGTVEVKVFRVVLVRGQNDARFGEITEHLRLAVTDDAPAPEGR